MSILAATAEQISQIATSITQGSDFGIGAGLSAIGAGVAAIGVGLGIGKISSAANESIARQPEAAGDIKGNTIVTSAFIEGAGLFAILVALLTAADYTKIIKVVSDTLA